MPHAAWNAIDEAEESSSLEASLETNDLPTTGTAPGGNHRNRSKSEQRIIAALDGATDHTLRRRAGRIAGCCQTPAIFLSDEGLPKLVMGSCKDRLCPRCQRARGKECARKTTVIVRGMNSARLLTFTLAKDGTGLKARYEKLAESFKRLRKDPWFKANCSGGIYGIETTRGRDGGHWHVHLHVIAEGDYMDQKRLSEAWKAASGGSIICHIKAIHDRGTAARYISEYVTKPADMSQWTDANLREFAFASHGRRLLHTFGSLHGKKVEPAEPRAGGKPTKFLVHTETLREHAAAGDTEARHVAEICSRLSPLWAGALGLRHAADAAGLAPVERWELELVVEVCERLNRQLYARDDPAPPNVIPPTPTAQRERDREQLALLPV